ncbi:MAG TPA: MauE/DoxX family redox-associated membrane protein [Candidatus Saccharimonadales bacterium]|nr:MauE/DoxX family redox-associated membrane protein [Candidatus Saccharimonadales bacterium]
MAATKTKTTAWLLQIGLAFVFIYAGVGSLTQPNVWLGYLPHFLVTQTQAHDILKLFAVYELLLAIWLLSGRWRRYAAVLSALTFLGIILAQPGDLLITFRDVGLLFTAAALFTLD